VTRVLLVDDDIAEISAVKRVLAREGHPVVLATSVADAVALAAQERPHLVIVAAACEGGGGRELARRLCAEEPPDRRAVLLLGEPGDVLEGTVLVPRPLDPAQLAGEVRLAVGEVAPAPPVARLPLEALSGGSPQATTSAARARADDERRAAADALQRRAEELRQARAEPDGWLEAPDRAPADAPESVDRRLHEQERLVAEIGEELDRLVREAGSADEAEAGPAAGPAAPPPDLPAVRPAPPGPAALPAAAPRPAAPGPPSGPSGGPADPTGGDAEALARAAAEIERRAEAEADRRREEAEAGRRLDAEAGRPRDEEQAARRRAQAAEATRDAATEPGPEPLPPPRAPGPPVPDASAAAPPELEPPLSDPPPELAAGTLAEAPAPRLLALAARAGLSGRLDFGTADPRSVYFEDGRIVGATSAAPAERVEEVALRLGLLTREQHRQAVPAVAGLSTRRAALALLDRGFLKPEELTPLVRRRTEGVVFALFGEAAGPFRFAPARVPSEERIALDRPTLPLAVEGVRRRWMEPRLSPLLGDAATLLSPAPRAPSAAELGLAPLEARVLALADGLRSLDEVLDGSPLDPLSTRQLLAAFVCVGALVPRFQGAAARFPAARAIDVARLREKLEQVRRADYFTILGLSRHCTPYEVREAAERLLAEFEPLRFHGLREPGLREKLDEVRRVVSEAGHVLADGALRAEYVEGLGG
jgi:CheY-like chemotaxis protein